MPVTELVIYMDIIMVTVDEVKCITCEFYKGYFNIKQGCCYHNVTMSQCYIKLYIFFLQTTIFAQITNDKIRKYHGRDTT